MEQIRTLKAGISYAENYIMLRFAVKHNDMRHQMRLENQGRTMISRLTACSLLVVVLFLLFATHSFAQVTLMQKSGEVEASGKFAPTGPPLKQPIRVDAGGSCIIDLKQAYDISGTLSGSLEIDYRILVYGPCEVPPVIGKYDEEWIAHGTFTGTFDGSTLSGSFTYIAQVRAGGDVKGRILLGGGLDGDLSVSGNFGDGELSYHGQVTRNE